MNKQITSIIGASIFLMAQGNVLAADSALPDAPSWAESQKHISYDEFMKAARQSFPYATPEQYKLRVENDFTLKTCNATLDQPNAEQSAAIVKFKKARLKMPADDKLLGDWKNGEVVARGTTGDRIGFADADNPNHPNGANCFACHVMIPGQPGGNMGPSLVGYGKRGQSPAILKYTYEHVYDAKMLVPCTIMPRYGGEGHLLTASQVADIVAFLTDPQSPVNQPEAAQKQ
ncbi:sulfur oxidation c-type cytochrome SoxX [Halothiobacillus sp.]|uniref:sulfur oxidation c-type cytochrome SoxX n=1 Tax=Halothiobacillus sp. TaxID=1891311 RepID=UPI003D11C8BF